jgi:hypothetical protein
LRRRGSSNQWRWLVNGEHGASMNTHGRLVLAPSPLPQLRLSPLLLMVPGAAGFIMIRTEDELDIHVGESQPLPWFLA